MVYLTWGIGFNGIFLSQVIGVCRYLSQLNGSRILLISLVPYPNYKETKKKIRKEYSYSIIIPMIPSRNHWWPMFAVFLLPILLIVGRGKLITRGVIANQMGLLLRKIFIAKKVIYDGRGAEKAEWTEYDIVRNSYIVGKIGIWENEAVNKSEYRLAVSKKLVEYWRKEYDYRGNEFIDHVVIPCTINSTTLEISINKISKLRSQYNYKKEDIILVYSGSAENWQSFHLIDKILNNLLMLDNNIKVLFLAKFDLNSLNTYQKYKERFNKMWVEPSVVNKLLSMCDYGLLIREDTVTNNVASPTKFAEYLAAGLKVIISENVGDFSNLVAINNLGIVMKSDQEIVGIERQSIDEKGRISEFAKSNFQKSVFDKEYRFIIES